MTIESPGHLQPTTRRWYQAVLDEYQLEPHHRKLLLLAAEAWDRCQQAREALAEYGIVYADRFGAPHARPEVGIERDSRLAFARLIRELALDVESPGDNRPPVITGNARLRGTSTCQE